MLDLPWLDEYSSFDFPPTSRALSHPNGLLAAGGDLSSPRILSAYSRGVFPWFSEGEPILWWTPNPRCVVFPDQAHCSKSLAKVLRKNTFSFSIDTAFSEVINHCSEARADGLGTWITAEMMAAYIELHQQGFAHSVEAWQDGRLVGGLYGIALGKAFFGESMFSLEPNASKAAFITLAQKLRSLGYKIIDCQVTSNHLLSLGAVEIDRSEFEQVLLSAECFPGSPKPGSLG